MSTGAVHALCFALVALDFVARTWRTQCFVRSLGHPLSFGEVFIHSALGETASSLTPLRLGGEPARVWAMTRLGVPARVAVVCVGVELVATSAIIVVIAGLLAALLAPQWWANVGPAVARAATANSRWIALVGALMVVAWTLAQRFAPAAVGALRNELAAARTHARRMPRWPFIASVPLTLLNVGARVAILPVLALTLTNPPPLSATIVGSFALLYSQAILPTPAGVGAVELGFLGGAAGDLGAEEAGLLLMWRLYSTVLGVGVGAVLTVVRYRWHVVPSAWRRDLRPRDGA